MNSIVIWSAIKVISEIYAHHIFTEKEGKT